MRHFDATRWGGVQEGKAMQKFYANPPKLFKTVSGRLEKDERKRVTLSVNRRRSTT